MKPYILAEIASAHHGDVNTLHSLIFESYQAGADGVKIQVWREPEIRKHKAYENLKKFEFSEDEWLEAAEIIKNLKLDLWCEIYSVSSLELAIKCKYTYMKSIYKLNNDSTFSAKLTIEELNRPYESSWWRFDEKSLYLPKNLSVGTQDYPTGAKQGWVDVNTCNQLSEQEMNVMYSCHQNPLRDEAYTIPLAAYQTGANIIEKHICLDRDELKEYSRDYLSSFEPNEFKKFTHFMKTTKVSALL